MGQAGAGLHQRVKVLRLQASLTSESCATKRGNRTPGSGGQDAFVVEVGGMAPEAVPVGGGYQ